MTRETTGWIDGPVTVRHAMPHRHAGSFAEDFAGIPEQAARHLAETGAVS